MTNTSAPVISTKIRNLSNGLEIGTVMRDAIYGMAAEVLGKIPAYGGKGNIDFRRENYEIPGLQDGTETGRFMQAEAANLGRKIEEIGTRVGEGNYQKFSPDWTVLEPGDVAEIWQQLQEELGNREKLAHVEHEVREVKPFEDPEPQISTPIPGLRELLEDGLTQGYRVTTKPSFAERDYVRQHIMAHLSEIDDQEIFWQRVRAGMEQRWRAAYSLGYEGLFVRPEIDPSYPLEIAAQIRKPTVISESQPSQKETKI